MTQDWKDEVSRRRFLELSAGVLGAGVVAGYSGGGLALAKASYPKNATISVDEPSYLQPGYKEQIDGLDAAFEAKYHSDHVKQVAPPFAQYHDAVLAQLQAGNPPDVIRVDDPQLQYYIDQNWLEPLDKWLKAAKLDPKTFINSEKDAMRHGHSYAVPRETNPRVFIYNKQILKDAGVKAPANLSQYKNVLKKVSNANAGQFGMGIATKAGDPTGLMIQLMPIIMGFGGSFFKGTKPTATDPKVIAALQFVKDLWDNNLIPRGLDAVTINNLVSQGKIASIISGSFIVLQTVQSNPTVGTHLAVGKNPLPSSKTMRATAWWAVPKKAQNKELGALYIMQLLQPNQQHRQVELTGTLPARRGMVPASFVRKYPWYKHVVSIGYAGKAESYFPQQVGAKGADALVAIGNGVLSILYQGVAPHTAMTAVQSQLLHL